MSRKRQPNAVIWDGMKMIDIWNSDEGWTIHSGEGKDSTINGLMGFVPVMFRAVHQRARAVASMPFALVDSNGNDYDTSQDWTNKVNFLPNPYTFLYMAEASLCLAGNAYFLRQANIAGYGKQPRYLDPNSITVDEKKLQADGTIEFKRHVGMIDKVYTPEQLIYFWMLDPQVELGPARNYPAKAASHAAGVLYNVDEFCQAFFQRGAIKSMLLTVTGNPPKGEREKLVEWWKRTVAGIRNAWGSQVINAENVKPVVIGEGMKELENVKLNEEKSQEVALAFDIPYSILFANAANFATSQQDKKNWYDDSIIPECKSIANTLNEQYVFDPYKIIFRHETLDIMQKDTLSQAQAGESLVKWLSDPVAEVALDIIGLELDDDQLNLLKDIWATKKANAQAMLDKLSQPAQQPVQPPGQSIAAQQPAEAVTPPSRQGDQLNKSLDLGRWQLSALQRLADGKLLSTMRTFESNYISAEENWRIASELALAKSADDVKAAFAIKVNQPRDAASVLEGIRLGIEALKYNESHDELGRFASDGSSGGGGGDGGGREGGGGNDGGDFETESGANSIHKIDDHTLGGSAVINRTFNNKEEVRNHIETHIDKFIEAAGSQTGIYAIGNVKEIKVNSFEAHGNSTNVDFHIILQVSISEIDEEGGISDWEHITASNLGLTGKQLRRKHA